MTAGASLIEQRAPDLGDKTVLNYMSLIRQKLGAANDLQLLRLAAQNGLVEL